MNQQDVEKWIAQNGGQGRVQYSRSTQRVANPAKQLTRPDGTDNPDYDPTAPATIDVSEEKWTAVDAEGKPTGAVLHARRRPDGDFDIVNQADANPTRSGSQDAAPPGGKPYIDDGPEAGQTGRRWGWNPATRAYDRDLGPSPSAQKPAAPTSKSDRKPIAGRPGYYEVTTADATTGKSETHYEDANGNRVEKLPPTEAEQRQQAEANKPKPQQAPDGSYGYFDTTKNPPVWVPIQNGPGAAAPKPVQVNGQWGVWQPNPSDPKAPPTFVTIEVPKPGVTLKNVDTWEPDFNQPDLGIGKWAASQRQKIGLPADQGGITQDDYDNSVKDVLGRAGTTITNVSSATNVVRQRQQDEESRRSAMSGEAASDFNNALGVFNQFALRSDESIRSLIPGLMNMQRQYRREREGDAKPLPGLHPMFQIASAQSAATAQPPAANEQAAGTGPTPEPYTPPGQPEKPAPVFTPQPPVNVPPTAAPAVPPPPAGAAAPAPTPAVSAPAMAAPPSAPVPPSTMAPSMPGPTDYTSPGAVEMPDGPSQYGGGQDMPKVSLDGGPLSAFASSAMGGPAPAASGAPLTPFANQAQQMGEGGFDPIARAADLERMGVPHEVAVQALVGSGLLDERTKRMLGMVA